MLAGIGLGGRPVGTLSAIAPLASAHSPAATASIVWSGFQGRCTLLLIVVLRTKRQPRAGTRRRARATASTVPFLPRAAARTFSQQGRGHPWMGGVLVRKDRPCRSETSCSVPDQPTDHQAFWSRRPDLLRARAARAPIDESLNCPRDVQRRRLQAREESTCRSRLGK